MNDKRKGSLEVITGCMFCGKTEELIRRLYRATLAKQTVLVVKPVIDTRSHKTLRSHSAVEFPAVEIAHPCEIFDLLADKTLPIVVGIDEAQFFDANIKDVALTLVSQGVRVIVAGLDLDYRGEPFGPMPNLLAVATDVQKLTAICSVCGESAYRTQLLVHEHGDPQVSIGGAEKYHPRCLRHFEG